MDRLYRKTTIDTSNQPAEGVWRSSSNGSRASCVPDNEAQSGGGIVAAERSVTTSDVPGDGDGIPAPYSPIAVPLTRYHVWSPPPPTIGFVLTTDGLIHGANVVIAVCWSI